MVSNTPNSENGTVTDITYVMPAFAGLPGLQEAARAFSRSGAFSEESLAVRAQLALVADQGVSDAFALVDDDQLGKAKIEALSRVPAGPVGSYSAVQEIVNKIKSSNDPREVMSLSSQLDAAINSTERLKGEEQDPETKEQKIDRLFAEIDQLEKQVKSGLEQARDWGYLKDKDLEGSAKLHADADELQKISAELVAGPEKDKAIVAAAEAAAIAAAEDERLAGKAQEAAIEAGRTDHAEAIGVTKGKARSIQDISQTIVDEAYIPQTASSVSQETAQNNASMITLSGQPKQTNEATYAYEDISNEHSGTLALQQGGTKDITLNQGKGGASI